MALKLILRQVDAAAARVLADVADDVGELEGHSATLGKLLRTDSSQALGGYARFTAHESTWRPWGELRHSVRTGEPAFDHVFAMPIFEYFAKMPEPRTTPSGSA